MSDRFSYYATGYYPTFQAPKPWDVQVAPNVGQRMGVKTASVKGREKVVFVPGRRNKAGYKRSPK